MGEAIRASFANALSLFIIAIPRVIAFLFVLIVGWFIASLLARGVAALLHAVRFNDLARRSGFAEFVHNMGVRTDSTGVLAGIVKWFVRLIVLVVAFDTLGLPAVSGVLQQLLLWLPNLVVALVVLVIGGLAAGALSRLVRGASAEAGLMNPDTLATVAKVAVWAFAIVVAVNQLQIATTLINTLLIGLVSALAIAAGIAFGLGGRERAAQVIDRMARRTEAAAPRIQRAAGAMREGAREMQEDMGMARGVGATGSMAPGGMGAGGMGAGSMADRTMENRSGFDRRRVARPGFDRRSNGST